MDGEPLEQDEMIKWREGGKRGMREGQVSCEEWDGNHKQQKSPEVCTGDLSTSPPLETLRQEDL